MSLRETDVQVWDILEKETKRQVEGIELIASENFTSPAVLEALGSVFTNKYAEGQPGKRYYGGNEFSDELESLCQKRALEAFRADPAVWGCNVQAYSGSVANMAVYLGILKPHDRITGLDLPSGGHLSHGYTTATGKRISAAAVFYESIPYKVADDGFLDYDEIERTVLVARPRLVICGGSAYSRDWDYSRLRTIADKVGAHLMADIAHTSGFVATGLLADPFPYCDIVTTTTHKTLRGPRSALIFFRRALEQQINDAVFPGMQGGPHLNQIAAVAVQLHEVTTPEFKQYMHQVQLNAARLCEELKTRGYSIITGGTDNHLFLVNLKNKGVNGSRAEKILDAVGISVNKNTIPTDTSALSPSGIRIGTPAITTRGFKEDHMVAVADLIDRAIDIAIRIQSVCNPSKLVDFVHSLTHIEIAPLIKELGESVRNFAKNKISCYNVIYNGGSSD
jgi:glycine hydroxymethyltransferase